MSSVSRRFSIAVDAIFGNRRASRFWADRPANAFTTAGYEVIRDFLDRTECDRLVRLAQRHLEGPSHVIEGNCYTWVKSEAAHGRNAAVRELLNVNEIDPGVARLMENRTLHDLFTERLGEPVELMGFGIQMDGVDTTTKRDFHVDRLFPPLLKAFVYLTDVEEDGDGPYTVIPGSHRRFVRKMANDFVNAVTTGGRRDMHRVLGREPFEKVLGRAGTLILSSQDVMHKGWGGQSRRPRYALIAYGTTAEHFHGESLTEGIEHVYGAKPVAGAA